MNPGMPITRLFADQFAQPLLAAGTWSPGDGAVGPLIDALSRVAESVALLAGVLSGLVWPWLPLVAWGGFWLLLVDWRVLLTHLHRGGWGIVLLLAVGVFVALGLLTPVGSGSFAGPRPSWLLGWQLSSNVQRVLDGAVLVGAALVAGAVQLGPWWSERWGRKVRGWTAEDSTGERVVTLPLSSLGRGDSGRFGTNSAGIS
jgi:hypothetical protein